MCAVLGRLFGLSFEYEFLRRAQLFVRAVHAAGPAAGAAHTFGKFGMGSLDPALSGLNQFGTFYPANPLVACQR